MSEATNDGVELSARLNADPEIGARETTSERRLPDAFEDQNWRSFCWLMLFLLSLLAGFLDPLFFYIPVMNDKETCVRPDKKLGVIAIVLRTCGDVVHTFFWLSCYEDWFRVPLKKCWCSCTGEPKAREEGDDEGIAELIREAREADATLARTENSVTDEKSELSMKLRIIEVASVLPLPQVATVLVMLRSGSPQFMDAVTVLKFSVLSQLIVRGLRVYPSYKGASRHSLLLLKGRIWIRFTLNLLLVIIAGHAIGAFWYLLSLGRSMDCWRKACRSHIGCHIASFYCGSEPIDKSFLNATCSINSSSDSPPFDFGIYLDALKSRVISSNNFPLKLGYCFWWGLRNLSSLGQSLSTSAYLWEVYFAISISILGLTLFVRQMFLQSQTINDLKEMKEMMEKREKQKNVRNRLVEWRPFTSLSRDLRCQIFLCNDSRWQETRDVDLRSVLENVPLELSQQIKFQLCFPLLSSIPCLKQVDKDPLEALSKLAKPVVFAKKSPILREDARIDKMYIILGGNLCFYGMGDGSTPKPPLECTDKLLGEELLHQALSCELSSDLPPLFHPETIVAQTKVEAFSITAEDIGKVRLQFQGLFYKQEKEELILRIAVSRFSQRKAVSPRQPAQNNTFGESRVHDSNGIIEGSSCPQIREDDPLP